MAFENHPAESFPGWRKAGGHRGDQGREDEGRPGWHVRRSTPEDGTPGWVPGPFLPPALPAPSKGHPVHRRPETQRFRLPPRRGKAGTASRAQGRSPPAPGTRVLSAEEGALGPENGQNRTLPAYPKSQPHPLYPSARPPRDGPRGPRLGPRRVPVGATRALQGREWE